MWIVYEKIRLKNFMNGNIFETIPYHLGYKPEKFIKIH